MTTAASPATVDHRRRDARAVDLVEHGEVTAHDALLEHIEPERVLPPPQVPQQAQLGAVVDVLVEHVEDVAGAAAVRVLGPGDRADGLGQALVVGEREVCLPAVVGRVRGGAAPSSAVPGGPPTPSMPIAGPCAGTPSHRGARSSPYMSITCQSRHAIVVNGSGSGRGSGQSADQLPSARRRTVQQPGAGSQKYSSSVSRSRRWRNRCHTSADIWVNARCTGRGYGW